MTKANNKQTILRMNLQNPHWFNGIVSIITVPQTTVDTKKRWYNFPDILSNSSKKLDRNLIDVFCCCSVSRYYSMLHDTPNCFNDYLWAVRRKKKSEVINCPYFQIITKVRVYFCCTRLCSIHSDAIQYLQLNFEI